LNISLIDTHAHLDMPEFVDDLDEVIVRARQAGVGKIVTIGINPASNLRAISLAESYPHVYAGIGIHPSDAAGISEETCRFLVEQARHPKVVVIGELGLDYHRGQKAKRDQLQVLQWQLEAVNEIGKPIVVHCRDAHVDFLPVITKWMNTRTNQGANPPGILHCFNLDMDTAAPYLEMGFFLSIGAYVGYPSSSGLRETVKQLPVERILIETDCPFLPPQKMRGQRNEPAYCSITAEVLAQIRGLPVEELAAITSLNAQKVFHIQ
jgi:TatD DNase family protein